MRGKGEGSIFKDSRGLWNGVIELPSHNGDRRRKVVRRKDKKELLLEMQRLQAELSRQGDLPTGGQTVEQWMNYWLREIAAKSVRPNTLDGYQRTVHNHILPAIGKVKLEKLTPTHIRRVHDAILDKGLSPTTALLAHRVMTTSFKVAMREGRMGRNPAALTEAPRKKPAELHALDLDEAIHIIRSTALDPLGALWATVLLTGARRGEVLGLERDRVGDVLDLSWQLLRLPLSGVDGKPNVPVDYEYRHLAGGLYLTRPKSRKGWRIIPLVGLLRQHLERHMAMTPDNEWGLLFTKNGRPISPDQASRDWRAMLKSVGIEKDVRLHDGRHTNVDLLYEAGVPEDMISELVGHSTRTMTQGYKSLGNRARLTDSYLRLDTLVTQPEIERRREIGA